MKIKKRVFLVVFLMIFFSGLVQAINTNNSNNSILYHDTGPFGEVLVYKGAVNNIFAGGHTSEGKQHLFLYTDYIRQCSSSWNEYYNNLIDCCYMNFNNKKNLDVLNIGLGCGIVAGKVADFSYVNSIDVVEINPLVINASEYFSDYNNNLNSNPKVEIINDDGYNYVKKTNSKYDHIIIEINNAVIAYASNLYTREAFSNIKGVLKENGTFTLWTGVGTSINPKTKSEEYKYLRTIYNTLKKEFNYAYYLSEGQVFVASDSKINLSKKLENPEKTIKINKMFYEEETKEINTLEYQPILKYINNINQSIEKSRIQNKQDLYEKVQEHEKENERSVLSETIIIIFLISVFLIILLAELIYKRGKNETK